MENDAENPLARSHPALEVRTVPIADVVPYVRNPRKNTAAIAKVAASLREFGWRQPIVVDEQYTVIAGHTRLEAARTLGMTEVPVHVATGLTPTQVKAYRLADNRVAEEAEWDREMLSLEVLELKDEGFELELTGFEGEELAALLMESTTLDPDADLDDAPEPPPEPITQPGDVYVLGNHRLVCGDSTDAGVWETLMQGAVGEMVWTDPPYGVAYVGKTKDALTIENDALDEGRLEALLRASLGLAWANCREGASWYVAAPAGPLHLVFGTVLKELEVWRQTIQWVKDGFVLGRFDYHYRNEPIFYGWKPGAAHYFVDDRTQDTVWEIPRPKRNADHPTMKPIDLVKRAIENSSKPGQIVLDPFGGSGTTLLAAEVTGRKARVIELDPRYCDVIVRRWEEATGQKAVRQ